MTHEHVRRTLSLPHGPVSYLEWAPAGDARAVIVLLHGGGVDSAELSWALLGPALAGAGYRVLAPDAPGYGESPLPEWPSTQENLVRFVGEFVDAMGLERFVLGGLSMGGGMALGFALDHQDRVRALLAFGSYGLAPRLYTGPLAGLWHKLTWLSLHSGMMDAMTRWAIASERLTRLSMRNLVLLPGSDSPELLAAIMAEARKPSAGVAFSQFQRAEFTWSGLRHDYSARLESLSRPVLLVNGERDVGVRVEHVKRAAAKLPDAEVVVVPGAAHWVTRDAPDVVARAVLDFLERRVR